MCWMDVAQAGGETVPEPLLPEFSPPQQTSRLSVVSWLSVGLSAATTLALGVLLWVNDGNIRQTSVLLEHVAAVRSTTQQTLLALQEAESAQRGFLVTRQDSYVDAYDTAVRRVAAQVSALRSLAAAEPEQLARVAQFAEVAERRVALLREGLSVARSGRVDEAFALVAKGRSRAAMQEASTLAAAIDDEEQQVASQHEALLARHRRRESIAAIVLVLMSTALVAAVAVGVSRQRQAEARLRQSHATQEALVADLQRALQNVKVLSGLLPICAHCKKIRDDQGYWQRIESYLSQHSEVTFSHGICPACMRELYPDLAEPAEPGAEAPNSA